MISALIAVTFLFADPEWVIRNTDIYRPLTSDQVAFSPSVGWFLLDVADQRIMQFDLSGERVSIVARAGEGPGELNRVQAVFWEAGRLYAVSLHRVQVFDEQGKYLEQMKRSDYGFWLTKIPKGWLSYPHPLNSDETQHLLVHDNTLAEKSVLTSWPMRVVRKKGSLPYRPDIFCFELDGRRSRLYLRKPDTSGIEIWDMTTREQVGSVPLGIELDPDAQFEIVLAEAKASGTGLTSNSWYPGLTIGPSGLLYFYPIRSKDRVLVFDADGKTVPAELTKEMLDRFIGVYGGQAYQWEREPETEMIGIKRLAATPEEE